MDREFNTTGPCEPELHYMLPAAARLPEACKQIRRGKYFVVHAPRQTGKTTTIRALAKELTASGDYAALAFSCQSAGAAGDDFDLAEQKLLAQLGLQAEADLPGGLRPPEWPEARADLLAQGLTAWAAACPRPLVLFFDEIDALRDSSLESVLGQLRTGFNNRTKGRFPASVILCGMRDLRDDKAASGGSTETLGGPSPFNILVKSLRLGNFTADEVAELYRQHTAETGQEFTPEGIEYAYEQTGGQPWLINALANEVIVEMGVPVDEAIGPRRLETAKERLIKARATHLDSLVKRLREPRVQRFIEPMLTGGLLTSDDTYNDDRSYVIDLGLLKAEAKALQIANPIYNEVIVRVLTESIEDNITEVDPDSFILADGRFNLPMLLEEFMEYWCENGHVQTSQQGYHEFAPQAVMQAYLHKAINGHGYVQREYEVAGKRLDLLIRWPYKKQGKRTMQREALELKVWRKGESDPLAEGLAQLDRYLDRVVLDTGTLIIFNKRHPDAPIRQRVSMEQITSPLGRDITLLRL